MTGSEAPSRRTLLPGYVSLFGSVGTLLCCALPALLVLLGLGATVAAFLSGMPWLVTLSRNKALVFAGAAVMIAANGYLVFRVGPRQPCAPGQEAACAAVNRRSRAIFWVSAAIYLTGFLIAYALGPLLILVDR